MGLWMDGFWHCGWVGGRAGRQVGRFCSVGRTSAFRAGGRGFESKPHHTKGVKIVQAAPLLALA